MDCKESNEDSREIVTPSAADEQPVALGPQTPVAKRENKDSSLSCDSPVTELKIIPKPGCFDDKACGLTRQSVSGDPASPPTPKDGLFDPFAPGDARPRRFDLSIENDNLNSVLDQEICYSVYESLLEFIMSKQIEEISCSGLTFDRLKTPSLTRLRASPDACPGAPMKRPAEARNIELGLCRKLF